MAILGYLRQNAPYAQYFPDGKVPLKSIVPVKIKREPPFECYIIEPKDLSPLQIRELANFLVQNFSFATIEEAACQIKEKGILINAEYFYALETDEVGFFI